MWRHIPVSSLVPKMGITSGLRQALSEPQLALKSDNDQNSELSTLGDAKLGTREGRGGGQVKKHNQNFFLTI